MLKNSLLLVSIILVLITFGFGQTESLPRFESAPCAVEIPKGERVSCGFLVVKEDRSSSSHRTIRLPVAILKSESETPKPDPVLRTLGGPGASTLRLVRSRRSSPWLKD